MKNRLVAFLLAGIMLALCASSALASQTYAYNRDFIIPDSDRRALTAQELWGFTRETLRFIRNELLARHGYAFSNAKFYNYFNAKSWYAAGGYNTTRKLTKLEWNNVTLVKQVEKEMDRQNTRNAGAVDITDIIAYQNSLGGYGDQNNYGNPRGDGSGQIIGYVPQTGGGSGTTQTPAVAITPEPNYIYSRQYIIPDSNSRCLRKAELWAYSRETLRYIRNELLARHGYVFGDNKFGRYFQTKAWYSEGGYESAILSRVEWDNVNLVREVERAMDILGTQNPGGLDINTIIQNQNSGNCPGGY